MSEEDEVELIDGFLILTAGMSNNSSDTVFLKVASTQSQYTVNVDMGPRTAINLGDFLIKIGRKIMEKKES